MGRWFRMYEEILDDPKVQRLSGDDFRGWINLLALASRNNGRLPCCADISFALRIPQSETVTLLERLRSGGLIARRSGGPSGAYDAPYKWEERQYKSDTSTPRVKRFRERSKTVTETPPETETDTLDKSKAADAANGVPDPVKELFDLGVAILVETGTEEKRARSLIGQWRKGGKEDAKVLQALLECRSKSVSEPIEWLQQRLKGAKYVSANGYEYRGSLEAIMREAEKRADWGTYWTVNKELKQGASQ